MKSAAAAAGMGGLSHGSASGMQSGLDSILASHSLVPSGLLSYTPGVYEMVESVRKRAGCFAYDRTNVVRWDQNREDRVLGRDVLGIDDVKFFFLNDSEIIAMGHLSRLNDVHVPGDYWVALNNHGTEYAVKREGSSFDWNRPRLLDSNRRPYVPSLDDLVCAVRALYYEWIPVSAVNSEGRPDDRFSKRVAEALVNERQMNIGLLGIAENLASRVAAPSSSGVSKLSDSFLGVVMAPWQYSAVTYKAGSGQPFDRSTFRNSYGEHVFAYFNPYNSVDVLNMNAERTWLCVAAVADVVSGRAVAVGFPSLNVLYYQNIPLSDVHFNLPVARNIGVRVLTGSGLANYSHTFYR